MYVILKFIIFWVDLTSLSDLITPRHVLPKWDLRVSQGAATQIKH